MLAAATRAWTTRPRARAAAAAPSWRRLGHRRRSPHHHHPPAPSIARLARAAALSALPHAQTLQPRQLTPSTPGTPKRPQPRPRTAARRPRLARFRHPCCSLETAPPGPRCRQQTGRSACLQSRGAWRTARAARRQDRLYHRRLLPPPALPPRQTPSILPKARQYRRCRPRRPPGSAHPSWQARSQTEGTTGKTGLGVVQAWRGRLGRAAPGRRGEEGRAGRRCRFLWARGGPILPRPERRFSRRGCVR